MPDSFEDRIREAIVVPADAELDQLRVAVKAAAGSLGSSEALDFVRTAYRREIAPPAEARLRNRLNSKEQVLAPAAERQMLATLSAITLIRVFSRPQYAPGLLPALAVRAARHAGWNPVHPDLEDYADAYLRERATVVRERKPTSGFRMEPVAEPPAAEEALRREVEALRAAVLSERELEHESNQLQWWLLSPSRPDSALDAALQFARLLGFNPEPLATEHFLRAKLHRLPREGDPVAPIAAPEVPEELADLCRLLPSTELSPKEQSPAVEDAYAFLNEILLIRALEARPIER